MNTAFAVQDHHETNSFLASVAMMRLQEFFQKETQHRPSPEMYRALQDIVETLSAMAMGEAERKVYLSSLDPGVGKTTAIVSFVDALLSYPEYAPVGVLLCVCQRSSKIPQLWSLRNPHLQFS